MDAISLQQPRRGSLHRSLRTLVRRFARGESGATAVEFGLIAVPFLALLFATLQIALVLWVTQMLETALANATRQLYTGQFETNPANVGQTPAVLQGRFKQLICDNIVGLFDCGSMVSVDVRVVSDDDGFGSSNATLAAPVTTAKVYDTSSYGFQMPASKAIVVVRASMEFPNYASAFSPATTLANGKQLIMATAAFRAEPF